MGRAGDDSSLRPGSPSVLSPWFRFLPPVVRKRLVGVCHTVRVFLLLDCRAAASQKSAIVCEKTPADLDAQSRSTVSRVWTGGAIFPFHGEFHPGVKQTVEGMIVQLAIQQCNPSWPGCAHRLCKASGSRE